MGKRKYDFYSLLDDIKHIIGLLIIAVLWLAILFNPVIISFYCGNPLYLLLYIMFPIEMIVGIFTTKIILVFFD